MGKSIKSKIKAFVKMTRQKQMIPVQHNVDDKHILCGKNAAIIGGSGGIGLEIAKSFSESGCNVLLCGTNEGKLGRVLQEFPVNAKVKTIVFDVTDFDAINGFIDRAVDMLGGIDILVYSAGVHTENVNFFTMTPEEYDRVMNVNIRAPFFICQKFAKYMVDRPLDGLGGAYPTGILFPWCRASMVPLWHFEMVS